MLGKMEKSGQALLAWLSVAGILLAGIIFLLNLSSTAQVAAEKVIAVERQVNVNEEGTLKYDVEKAKEERAQMRSDIRNLATQAKNTNDNIDRLISAMDKTNDKLDKLTEKMLEK